MGCGASKNKYKANDADGVENPEAPKANGHSNLKKKTMVSDDSAPGASKSVSFADDKPPKGATEDPKPKKEETDAAKVETTAAEAGATQDPMPKKEETDAAKVETTAAEATKPKAGGLHGVTALEVQGGSANGGAQTPQGELESLLRDIRVGTTFKSLSGDELAEKKRRGKELMEKGMEPSPGALFYYKMNEDKNQNVDRMEFMQGISKIEYESTELEVKITELFTNGDGAIVLEEWLEICAELPELSKAIEKSGICDEMKAHCKELLD